MDQHEARPQIMILTVPGCPNAAVVRERIDCALDGRDLPVDWVEVADEAGATQWKMSGSPTILLDGADPFSKPGCRPSLSCRLYRHEDGTTDGAPTVVELRRALAGAGPAPTRSLGGVGAGQ